MSSARLPRRSFVVTVAAASLGGAIGACEPAIYSTNPGLPTAEPTCPTAMPNEGDTCLQGEATLVCDYPCPDLSECPLGDSCGVCPTQFQCIDGSWTSVSMTYNPPPRTIDAGDNDGGEIDDAAADAGSDDAGDASDGAG